MNCSLIVPICFGLRYATIVMCLNIFHELTIFYKKKKNNIFHIVSLYRIKLYAYSIQNKIITLYTSLFENINESLMKIKS